MIAALLDCHARRWDNPLVIYGDPRRTRIGKASYYGAFAASLGFAALMVMAEFRLPALYRAELPLTVLGCITGGTLLMAPLLTSRVLAALDKRFADGGRLQELHLTGFPGHEAAFGAIYWAGRSLLIAFGPALLAPLAMLAAAASSIGAADQLDLEWGFGLAGLYFTLGCLVLGGFALGVDSWLAHRGGWVRPLARTILLSAPQVVVVLSVAYASRLLADFFFDAAGFYPSALRSAVRHASFCVGALVLLGLWVYAASRDVGGRFYGIQSRQRLRLVTEQVGTGEASPPDAW